MEVIEKYDSHSWLSHSQHIYCVYYCVHMLGTMANINIDGARKIMKLPNVSKCLLGILSGKMTWWEQRAAARAISNIIAITPSAVHSFVDDKINIAQLCLQQYTTGVKHVIIKECLVIDRATGYVQDLILKISGRTMCYDDHAFIFQKTIETAIDWIKFIRSILYGLSKYGQGNVLNLFYKIGKKKLTKYLENICEFDICWNYLLHARDEPAGGKVNCIDIFVFLSRHKNMAKLMGSSRKIIEILIIKLRDIFCSGWRIDEVIYNLLSFNAIDKFYYFDLCVSLMSLIEFDRTFNYQYEQQSTKYDVIIKCLNLLFNIPSIQLTDKRLRKKFSCKKCGEIVKNPHKISCKHNYCYFCLSLLPDEKGNMKCIVTNCKNCITDRNKRLKFNFKLQNDINSSEWKMNDFAGTKMECWKYIKENHKNVPSELVEEYLIYCDFMIKDAQIITSKEYNELIKEVRQLRIKGNNYFKEKQYEEAVKLYKFALFDKCPTNPNKYNDRVMLYQNISLTYLKMGQYFNAYKFALNGLSKWPENMKLLNILLKCYQYAVNTHDSLITPFFNHICDSTHGNNTQKVILADFYNICSLTYMTKIRNIKSTTDVKSIHKVMDELLEKDEYFKLLRNEMMKYKQQRSYQKNTIEKWMKKYDEFKIQRQEALKAIHNFIFFVLNNKEKFWIYEEDESADDEEWVTVEDMWDVINDWFVKDNKLANLNQKQIHLLISGYTNFIGRKKNGSTSCYFIINITIY